MRIFIGYDAKETVAYHVLAHSILSKATLPLSLTPLNRQNLAWWDRPRGPHDSTDFAITRFLVPYLSGYKGISVFMDCDMLCRVDIRELQDWLHLQDWEKSIWVVKHDYHPKEKTKFLGQAQTVYARKNWSSLIVFNNSLCRALSPDAVANAPGLDLHQFKWLGDDQIGEIPKAWNYLVGEENQEKGEVKLVHFTNGTPCFPQYRDQEYADEWMSALYELNAYAS